jgi:putative superfamily III holin-X
MATPETEPIVTPAAEHDTPGLGEAVKSVSERASTLVRLEMELAALELKRKISSLAVGIGLAVAAAVLLLFVIGFGLATIAAGIATATSTWLALLIVTAGVLLVAGIVGLIGMSLIKKGTPPVPEQAIQEAKLTKETLRHDGHQ